jgi:hypothetical protein
MRIAVFCDGAVLVTKPTFLSHSRAEFFIKQKLGWIARTIEGFSKKPQKLLAHYSVKDFRENKQRSLELVMERITYLNQFYKHEINNINIKNQKTRWGSCSGKRNLSFNYKIIFLPGELQDYIIVHELCHLKEMNHSRKFWDLVMQSIPDYKTRQEKIKLY